MDNRLTCVLSRGQWCKPESVHYLHSRYSFYLWCKDHSLVKDLAKNECQNIQMKKMYRYGGVSDCYREFKTIAESKKTEITVKTGRRYDIK